MNDEANKEMYKPVWKQTVTSNHLIKTFKLDGVFRIREKAKGKKGY